MMKPLTVFIAHVARGTIAALGMLALVAPMTVDAQTTSGSVSRPPISNIATAQWTFGDQVKTVPSNEVVIAVDRPILPPSRLTFYEFTSPPGDVSITLAGTQCIASGGVRPINLSGPYAGTNLAPANLKKVTAIRAGTPLVMVLSLPELNRDPTQRETVRITVQGEHPGGDSEQIEVTETGVDNGQFAGFINTRSIPPVPVAGDCALSVKKGEKLHVETADSQTGSLLGAGDIDVLIDPFGIVFDSVDGSPVDGARVTLIDAATGQPATVFGDDGISLFPSSVIAGSTVTDASGAVYAFEAGFYRFPFARPGNYRLQVEPPAPYAFESKVSPENLSDFRRADGQPYTILPGSYGQIITLDDPEPVRVDIPVDRPVQPLIVSKTASVGAASPGDMVQYRVTIANGDARAATGSITVRDELPAQMRLRLETLRFAGQPVAAAMSDDGRSFSVVLPSLPARTSGLLTYIAEVRVDARPGDAINRAQAIDRRGVSSNTSDAVVRVVRDGISERYTVIGRITTGGCNIDPVKSTGISGVRVMMEDGRYAITDRDGRYHFEGILPGRHVVQVDPSTFPLDQEPVDCARNTRSAGSAISRFVDGQGGMLKRADFRARTVAPRAATGPDAYRLPEVDSDPQAAGADRDWFVDKAETPAWLFPEENHNPRVKAIRIAVRTKKGQSVVLFHGGKRVDELLFDGEQKSPNGRMRVSLWRGVPLEEGANHFTARILDSSGAEITRLERTVWVAGPPIRAVLLKDKSLLRADGIVRPVIAVRLTDRQGRPVPHGSVGEFAIPAPYAPAVEADAQQASQLSGLERARPVWRVHGEDGIAYIELQPTSVSGSVSVTFPFQDGEIRREQRIDTWLDPGDRSWTVVGIAEGTVGFDRLDEGLQAMGARGDSFDVDGRLALYAKGRVTGKWLMTMAYDSDKKEDQTRFGGIIDPRRYYTVYADRSEQRYDAASVRRLYLKLERPQFYALFGDYETGINEPQLARYQRALNGVKAEYRSEQVHALAFGADTPFRYRREEIQGNGLTGPYALGSRDILANSDRISLQVRDRLRSDRIVSERQLTRHIDYDIDYTAGTLRFREPVLSRSSDLDPQFIVAEYEVDGIGQRAANAGGRASWRNRDDTLRIGATAIHDEDDRAKTNLGGADIVFRPGTGTEVRAEMVVSDRAAKPGATGMDEGTAKAWLIEAEHHDSTFDVLAYVRQQQSGFGVGQQNGGESGTRKIGLDGVVRVNERLSVSGKAYQEEYTDNGARRRAGEAKAEYRTGATRLLAAIAHAEDQLADGDVKRSTIARLGASQQLLDGKLEVDGQTEFALGGQDDSVDFPARHRVGARYRVNNDVQLVGSYEIAKGDAVNARTARVGFDLAPWAGGRIVATANQQDIGEFGPRSFAAYGLSQSFRVNEKWSLDFTLDGNRTLGGIRSANVLNTGHPVSSGGFLGNDNSLTEDFMAATGGASYRAGDWSWNARAEYRDGETVNRYGLTTALLRQIGEGSALGGQFTFTQASQTGGASTRAIDLEASWAHRPADSNWSWLEKIEVREDRVRGALAGGTAPIGPGIMTVDGNATSRRIINSFSLNYTPVGKRDGQFSERGEYGLFWGTRYVSERIGPDDIAGWSNVIGLDAKFDLGERFDIGVSGTVRAGTGADSVAWSGGPKLGITPFDNGYLSLGYNFAGFSDRDFEDSRYTRSGPFLSFSMKIDQTSFAALGL